MSNYLSLARRVRSHLGTRKKRFEHCYEKLISTFFGYFGIIFVFRQYGLIPRPGITRVIIFHGFSGLSYIGTKHYLNRKILALNFMDDDLVAKFLQNIHTPKISNLVPVSFIESALHPEGMLEPKISYGRKNTESCLIIGPRLNSTIFIPAEENFFHFYIQVLPFILRHLNSHRIVLALDPKLDIIQILEPFGISAEIQTFDSSGYFDKIASPRQKNLYPSSQELLYLRAKIHEVGYQPKPLRNIYITRRGNPNGRSIANEDELMGVLQNFGFEVIDPNDLDFRKQLQVMSEARMVVAPHGAALSHLVCVSEGASVLEINAMEDVRWHIRKMSHVLNLRHTIFLYETDHQNRILVNTSDIQKFLESTLDKNFGR